MTVHGRVGRVGFAIASLLVFALLMAIRETLAGTLARALVAALAFAFGAASLVLFMRLRA
jgi:heme/copper-type cytochrome/quinol oxidase subunit 4